MGRQGGEGWPQGRVQVAGSMEVADGEDGMGWRENSGIEHRQT